MVLIILLLLFHTGHGVDYPTTTVPTLDMVLIILLLLFHTGHGVDYPTTTVPYWTWC
ncbi:hypothetical protein DPMN_130808 [Dreissena polymorpha]|uniref:Uncharacterized protein n=1 Tax=Dreissena polymorpha TaxID=45954 RepID=A0A9D4H5S3_DREPO|nr:hypothetical protein DPMN_130792 [Dreissena polymorpha]KAH3828811.1 hypothetical protein DPMN_130795 [Dreissena polymorpha]KAH3828812.1 hypothetical protein DPMN_130796 [Dreissena polymorpha]KAH3828822.1 hypothetical protein DPMN_130806 [Dreissena polymorpha]KAH3828824.1 hypothetical protein DPMN_130808 [Dreissena polymorpha]